MSCTDGKSALNGSENGALVRKIRQNGLFGQIRASPRMEWEIAHWRCKSALKMSAGDANCEMSCGYCGSKTMHFGKNVMRMYKTAGRKEKCDVVCEMSCGYCGSKTMHFGKNVMRMYKNVEDVQNSLKMLAPVVNPA